MNFSIEWIPGAAVLLAVLLLSAPLLGWLIAVVLIVGLAAAALAGIAGAVVAVPYLLIRAARRDERAPVNASHPEALAQYAERT